MQLPIIFETGRSDTSQTDSEFFLAMLKANAQAESEATSSQVKWRVRAAFRDGKARYQYRRWLEYRKSEDGRPRIIPEEYEVVKRIYDAYLSGQSPSAIKYMLVKNCHPAIISRETSALVQKEMAGHTAVKNPEKLSRPPQDKVIYSGKYVPFRTLFCGMYGSPYRRCTWERNGKRPAL